MKRFWAELISSLYNIKDGIIKKKQEDEAEKEELRNQIAELEENSNSQDSIVVEPFAMFRIYSDFINNGLSESPISTVIKNVKRFDKSFIYGGPALALYKIEDFEQANNNNNSLPVDDAVVPNSDNLSLKDNKIYFLNISPRQIVSNTEIPRYLPFLDTNRAEQYVLYEPRPFVQNGQAFDFSDTDNYAINLESLQIGDGLEIEDLNNLYFIIGTNIS